MLTRLSQGVAIAVAVMFMASPAIGQQIEEWEHDRTPEEDVVPRDHDRMDDPWADEWDEDLDRDENDVEVVMPEPAAPPVREPQVAIEIGGGYSDFTGDLGDQLHDGGNWDVRGIFGTASPIAIEATYFGSANGLVAEDGTAITTAGELQARLNVLQPADFVQPFIAGGANYFRIDSDGALDNVQAIGFPVTAGLQVFPTDNFTIGARGSYRFLTDLIDDDFPGGDNWNVGLTVGATF